MRPAVITIAVVALGLALALWAGALPLAHRTPEPVAVQIIEEPVQVTLAVEHDAYMRRLRQCRAGGRIRAYEAGRSVKGRPVQLLVATGSRSARLPRTRVLVISGQHGDEPAAPSAVLEALQAFASVEPGPAAYRSLGLRPPARSRLDDVLWLIVPVANPDGMVLKTRSNAAGVDINRDWVYRTQPETRIVKRVFDRWRPQLVLDLHQWSPGDPPPAANGLEVANGPDATAREYLAREQLVRQIARDALGTRNAAGLEASLVSSRADSNPNLAHRYFASRGAASYLVETAAIATPAQRRRMLLAVILSIAESAAGRVATGAWAAAAGPDPFQYPQEYKRWHLASFGPKLSPAEVWVKRHGTVAAVALWAVLMAMRPKGPEAPAPLQPARRRPSHPRTPGRRPA